LKPLKKLTIAAIVLGALAAIVLWMLSAPNSLSAEQVAAFPQGDATRGETVFWAGGCTSCHSTPGSKFDDKLVLAGGLELKTPFGTFRAPNISPDSAQGLGGWSLRDFANSMKRGVSPAGQHHYPAFPFTSYARMTDGDIADLFAFIKTLPPSNNAVPDHDLGFPFNIRRGLGLWKLLFLDPAPVAAVDTSDAKLARGQYLVEALGHCGECHTPRNPIGGLDNSRWLAGGVGPETTADGKPEKIPNITPHETGLAGWSEKDISYGLETGFTPEFDSFGSSMVAVQENMAKLPAEDREAIAAYLKAVPAVASRE